MPESQLANIQQAIADIRDGKMVILVDDQSRENEGDLIIAAEKITPEVITFMIKYGSGLVCMPIEAEVLDRLKIPMMVKDNRSKYQTAFTVSIGAAEGMSTGISPADRAHTIRVAIDSNTSAADIVMPGHVFPLRAQAGGVLARSGHTEGSVDLARLAGLKPAAVLCEVINPDGSMARMHNLIPFAKQHGLNIISIQDIMTYRIQHENLLAELASARLPLQQQREFVVRVFESQIDHSQHIALLRGEMNGDKPVLVRLHSECITGDTFGSARCDCGWQLQAALSQIGQHGGVLLYMKQEGRGIGLANKVKAYALQDQGLDTVEANHQLGFTADQRDYGIAAQILQRLGVSRIRLLTNNPEKIASLERYGIEVVAREAIEMPPTRDNVSYLHTKREKLGHLLSLDLETGS